MVPLLFFLATVSAVPAMDLPTICRGQERGLPHDQQAGAYESCLRDEKSAQDELRQNWPHFPADARTTCAMLGRMGGSYVEVATCIEIKTGKPMSTWPLQPPPPDLSPPAPVKPGAPDATGQQPKAP